MKKEEFTIESRDGRRTPVHCVKWIPESGPVCILQIVHGMAEYVERYEAFAAWLCGQGVLVTGEDHLGHGKTAPDGGLGYFCENDPATVVVRDVHRLKKTVQAQYPGVPYILLGHSMGSFIARNYLMRYGTGIQGAVIMGTGMTPRPLLAVSKLMAGVQARIYGPHHIAEALNRMAFGSYGKRIDPCRTPFDWLSANEQNVQAYLADPLCGFTFTVNGFQTLFELLWRLHDRRALENMPKTLPVLFIAGTEDPVGGYGEAVRKVCDSFRALGMEKVSIRMLEGDRHEILNEDDAQTSYQYIMDWMKQAAGL